MEEGIAQGWDQGYWKQTLKESHTLHLLPESHSTWCFPIHSPIRKFRLNFHSTNCVHFPRKWRRKKDFAQDPRSSYFGRAWMSPQVSLTANGLSFSHIKSSTSVAPKSHTELPEQLAVITLPDSGQALLMMSASSTWPYGGFIAAFPFRASGTLGRKNLI